MLLDYFALGLLVFVVLVLFYGIIAIHDIPYEIAKRRDHPHQEAIHIGGWVSLFTLHAIWPFLWIWATLYHPERGYGLSQSAAANPEVARLAAGLVVLEARLAHLETRHLEGKTPPKPRVSIKEAIKEAAV